MDHTLRRLRRAWLESQAVDDEARYLAERVRQGELAPERVELCAWLGHQAAVEALDAAPPAGRFVPWHRWGTQVDPEGHRTLVETAFRVRVQDAVDSLEPPWGALAVAIQRWCHSSDADTKAEVSSALGALDDYLSGGGELPVPGQPYLLLRSIAEWVSDAHGLFGHQLELTCLGYTNDYQAAVAGPLTEWALGAAHPWAGVFAPSLSRAIGDYLAECVSSGLLAPEDLTLAAYAKDSGALLALDRLGQSCPESPPDLDGWLRGLVRLDRTVVRGAVLAAASSLRLPSATTLETFEEAVSAHADPSSVITAFGELLELSSTRRLAGDAFDPRKRAEAFVIEEALGGLAYPAD